MFEVILRSIGAFPILDNVSQKRPDLGLIGKYLVYTRYSDIQKFKVIQHISSFRWPISRKWLVIEKQRPTIGPQRYPLEIRVLWQLSVQSHSEVIQYISDFRQDYSLSYTASSYMDVRYKTNLFLSGKWPSRAWRPLGLLLLQCQKEPNRKSKNDLCKLNLSLHLSVSELQVRATV